MLQLALVSTLALTSQVRLLTAVDVQLAAPMPAEVQSDVPAADPKPVDAKPADAPVAATTAPEAQMSSVPQPELYVGYHFLAGAVAAVVFVPISLYLGELFGSFSNSLIWSAIPVLLCIGLIPPLAVTIATVVAGNWNAPGRYRWWPAFLATLVINGLSLPIAASLGLSVGVASRVIVYTLVQAMIQPGAAVLLERAWPRPQPTVLTVNDPVAPTTWVVPTGVWSF